MSDTLLVSTRKGLFVLQRDARRWRDRAQRLPRRQRHAGPRRPARRRWYAALDLGHFGVKLQRSADRGATWTELAVPGLCRGRHAWRRRRQAAAARDAEADLGAGGRRRRRSPAGCGPARCPAACSAPTTAATAGSWCAACGTAPERAEWFGGGYDVPGIHSICVDPRDRARLRLAVSCGGVWRSDDGGATWAQTAQGMCADYMPAELRARPQHPGPAPHGAVPRRARRAVGAAPQRRLPQRRRRRALAGGRRMCRPRCSASPSAVHPRDRDTAWFVPAVKDEMPRARSTAGWSSRARATAAPVSTCCATGCRSEHAYDLVYRHGLAVDATGERLAFGSTTGGLWISDDGGDRWRIAGRAPAAGIGGQLRLSRSFEAPRDLLNQD